MHTTMKPGHDFIAAQDGSMDGSMPLDDRDLDAVTGGGIVEGWKTLVRILTGAGNPPKEVQDQAAVVVTVGKGQFPVGQKPPAQPKGNGK
jgi:hypothetical protein